MRVIKPDEEVHSWREVDFRHLWTKGFRALLFDLENTLCPWRSGELPRPAANLLRRLKAQGFKIAVLTNTRLPEDSPLRQILDSLGIPVLERARKPLPFGFRRALRLLGAKPKESVVIGDQLLTDILGGKLVGLYTILVAPLSPREARITRLNRVLERWLGRTQRRRSLSGKFPKRG